MAYLESCRKTNLSFQNTKEHSDSCQLVATDVHFGSGRVESEINSRETGQKNVQLLSFQIWAEGFCLRHSQPLPPALVTDGQTSFTCTGRCCKKFLNEEASGVTPCTSDFLFVTTKERYGVHVWRQLSCPCPYADRLSPNSRTFQTLSRNSVLTEHLHKMYLSSLYFCFLPHEHS